MARDNSTARTIREASIRLFATKGFEATGIRDIAKDVGLTPGAMYHYIGTKEDLLVAIMRDGTTKLLEDAQAAVAEAPGSPADQLAALVDVHVRTHAEVQMEAQVADHEVRSLGEANRRSIVKLRDEYEALWDEVILGGVEAGLFQIDDPHLYRLAAIQMCTGVANWYTEDGALDRDQVAERFARMLLEMAGVPSARSEGPRLVRTRRRTPEPTASAGAESTGRKGTRR